MKFKQILLGIYRLMVLTFLAYCAIYIIDIHVMIYEWEIYEQIDYRILNIMIDNDITGKVHSVTEYLVNREYYDEILSTLE